MKCQTIRRRHASSSSSVAKVRDGALPQFHANAVKRHIVCRIDCLACQDELLVNNPL
jgi:hypothetical protein